MAESKRISPKAPENLLHTKLMPPRLHSALVPRVVLLRRLDDGLNKKLTLITAPTGFGKTTLARMWLDSQNSASAWVTLDGTDNDPVRFWTYVITAIRRLDETLGKSALAMLMASQPPSLQTVLTSLINDFSQLSESLVLVLDEYQSITSAEIHETLSFLLQHLPEPLHLILISRNEPDLPLALLRARNELVEINVTDLRFTVEETGNFLNTIASIEVSNEIIQALYARTEGWPAGLRLAALALKNAGETNDAEKLIQSFSGTHRYVADYLINEVFESQPEDVQEFLLHTCFFDRLTASLCNAVFDNNNSASLLDQLERDNLFITQLEHSGKRLWYRYNPLFAESIQQLARLRLSESEIQSIFEKASLWYETQGQFDDAIETALAAGLLERASDLIEKFIEIHDIGELYTLDRWLENVPIELLRARPKVCFVYAQVILYSSDRFSPATAARIEPFLRAAERAWHAKRDDQALGQVLSFRGTVTLWQGEFQKAFEYANQSLEKLPEYDALYRGTSLLITSNEALSAGKILSAQDQILEARALLGASQNIYGVLAAIQMLADVFYWQGELGQTEQLAQQILADAVGDESMLDDRGHAALMLALVAYERNDLQLAEQMAAQARELASQRNNEILQVEATIRLAYIRAAKEDWSEVEELLTSLIAGTQNLALLREVQETQARLAILSGNLSSLKNWLAVVTNEKQEDSVLQKQREAFTLARLQIEEGQPDEALLALEGWAENAAENGRVRSLVEALSLEALVHYTNSNVSQAVQTFSEALTIGQEKGFCRLFLDEGPRMATLLQTLIPKLPGRAQSLFATTLLHSFSPEINTHLTVSSPTVPFEALSQQEERVLRLIVAGSSNSDIAQELVVSINTVKTHVKSIYRKLNVRSRDEAREIARGLKLV